MPDVLILAGPDALSEALRDGAGRRVLLRPDAGYPADAHAAIRAYAPSFGPRLYVPPAFADDAPEAYVIAECGPLGEPLETRLRRHRDAFGARAAALVRPVALRLLVAAQAAQPEPLDAPELPMDGTCLYSEQSGCAYTAEPADGGWRFTLFDTEQSLARRRALCEQLGLECLLLTE